MKIRSKDSSTKGSQADCFCYKHKSDDVWPQVRNEQKERIRLFSLRRWRSVTGIIGYLKGFSEWIEVNYSLLITLMHTKIDVIASEREAQVLCCRFVILLMSLAFNQMYLEGYKDSTRREL